MSNYFYKTKKITLSNASFEIIKTEEEVYTTLSIVNNSDEDIKVIENDLQEVDLENGTILGSKKMLSYDNVPKNAIYISTESENTINILIKYSE